MWLTRLMGLAPARAWCAASGRASPDRGAVTVEGAVALCSLVLVFGAVLCGVAVAADQLRCTDAAGEAARMLARGDHPQAEEAVRRLGPAGAELNVRVDGVEVTATVRANPAGGLLPGVTVRAEAHAELEPGVEGVSGAGG